MKPLITLLAKDLRLASRDNIALYMVLGLAALCLVLRLWLPLSETRSLSFAVSEDLPRALLQELEAHGELIRLPDGAAVEQRVRGLDDLAGLRTRADGQVEVVLEGQEGPAVAELASLILARYEAEQAGSPGPTLTRETLPAAPSKTLPAAAALLMLGAALAGGVIAAFSVVEEREQGALAAYAVSPLSSGQYLQGKALLVAGVVLAGGALDALLAAGPVLPWGPVLLALLGCVPVGWVIGTIIGGAADNQLSAVAALKGLSLIVSGVPVASFLVPPDQAWALAPFPNHWAFQALFKALQGQPGWAGDLGMALLLGLPMAGIAGVWMRRRLGM